MKNRLSLLFFFLIQINFTLKAQVADSTKSNNTAIDTVYLYEDPLVIRKTVYYNRKENGNADNHSWMLDIFGGSGYTFNQFSYCPNCDTYNNIFKKSFSSKNINFSGGVNISKIYRKIVITGTTYLLMITDKVSNDSISSRNKYMTLNIGMLIGYKIGKSRFNIIPSVGPSFSVLLNEKGMYLNNDLLWKSIQSSNLYYKYTLDLNIRTKLLWKFDKRTGGYIEPFGLIDLQNIVTNKVPFNLFKRTLGVNVGLSRSL